jgi:very-short-patch-repair endonuclease
MNPAVKGGTADYLSIRGRYSQKVVDFVLLDGAFEVVALVELDDRTHRLEKDAARDAMTAEAGYVTLRYHSRHKPEPSEIREDLRRLHAALGSG